MVQVKRENLNNDDLVFITTTLDVVEDLELMKAVANELLIPDPEDDEDDKKRDE
jgi:hypothetical protein